MIELLYFDGCPNHEPVSARLPQLLERAGVATEIEFRRVESDADAQRLRFLGSPTVRIDGRDVEPGADERDDFGLKCRLYRSAAGLRGEPLDEWILAALGAPDAVGASATDENFARADRLLGGQSAKTRRAEASQGARAIHRSVIESFLAGHAPRAADLERWTAELDLATGDTLAELEARDLVLRDTASGDVATAYPFSGVPTAHSVRLRQSAAEVYAMCAIDALGIPFLARQAGEVRSREAAHGEPVCVFVTADGAARSEPADVAVIVGRTGDGPSAIACCPYLNFVSDRASAEALLAGTPSLEGEVLDLADAVALGREIFGGLLDEDEP